MRRNGRLANNVLTMLAATLVAPSLAVYLPPAYAQDAIPGASGNTTNPLDGLFTPQPQYPTPQTIMNPEPVQAPGQTNPLNGLFTPQPQYPTPQTIMNPQAAQPPGQSNPLNGLFTAQPQYPTPQTIMNPEPVPKNFQPETAPTENVPLAPPAVPASTQPAAAKAKVPAKAEAAKKKVPAKKPGGKAGAKPEVVPPPPPPVYNPLKAALFNINLGQYQTGINILDKVLQGDPNNAEAHYVKAVALVFQQKFADAAAEYRKVLILSPNSELGQRAEEGLKRINH